MKRLWKQILTLVKSLKMSLTQSVNQMEQHNPPLGEPHGQLWVAPHSTLIHSVATLLGVPC